VGAYPNSLSPFGTFDMGGDVSQWNEADILGNGFSAHGMRGGSYATGTKASAASFRDIFPTGTEVYSVTGFRVASVGGVPEPSTGLLAALACGVFWFARRRVQSNDAGI
jgi:formylglycine-generating enzyme